MIVKPRWGRNFLSRGRTLLLALPVLALLCPVAARAQVGSDRFSSIVVSEANGTVLESVNPDAPRHPASLAKLMTLYIAFEALRDRRITLDTTVPVSAHCASMQPTKLGLRPGMPFTVQQAILGMVTWSANDAACALGELLGGSEEQFAEMMTLRARALGMSQSHFSNASGLPAPDQWTTARDMAILARDLITNFPEDYHYFSTPSFVFHGSTIPNIDAMLKIYPGADGIKTGYTNASGHNMVTSAVRDGIRLIGVEMGTGSNLECNTHMAALLNASYAGLDVQTVHPYLVSNNRMSLIGEAHAATLDHAPPPAPVVHVADRIVHVVDRARIARSVARPVVTPEDWAVQVGVYWEQKAARAEAFAAHRIAGSGYPQVLPGIAHGRRAWRSVLVGMTAPQAEGACSRLTHHRTSCLVLRPEAQEVASR
ncbi:MAG TPA: D-alanyl-D-alanine carboxypeptidase family protein [Acetobacteraceae bacterium]|nr:D-alanyl-D-alanine carboxypeptidase family protein [Acetobacteraceae bacterium]